MMFLKFAWRYIKGKKSTQAIQILSWITVAAMAIGTSCLLIILSVFNGFEGFIKSLYTSFYPDLRIVSANEKRFTPTTELFSKIENLKGIVGYSKTLEEKILYHFNGTQQIAVLKGVDENYEKVSGLKNAVQYGNYDFSQQNQFPKIVMGLGLANQLGVSENSLMPLECFVFKGNGGSFSLGSLPSYASQNFVVSGLFLLQEEMDSKYGFADLNVVKQFLEKENELSAIEIKCVSEKESELLKEKINVFLPKNLKCETRYEQNKTLFFILKSERWAVFAILTLMLCIASFNIVGSLSMLVLEKQKDISILKTLGATPQLIKKIFLSTGILLSVIGAGIGCLVAFIICFLQQKYGLVTFGTGGNFLLEAYPVKMKFEDFMLVFFTVLLISFFASYFPAIKASRREVKL